MSKLNMKYFFIILIFIPSLAVIAGSSGSKSQTDEESPIITEDKKPVKIKRIQIIPIKFNRKDEFLSNQLSKMAIRHIMQTGKYELNIGDVNPKITKNFDFENLDIRVRKGSTYSLELRIFELERDTLMKKVVASGLKPESFLQEAEKMFENLFLDEAVQKD